MATPEIHGISASPDPLPAGGTGAIFIDASDTDDGEVTVNVTVTDSSGNTMAGSATFPVADILSYEMTVDRGSVVQNAENPAVFDWTDA